MVQDLINGLCRGNNRYKERAWNGKWFRKHKIAGSHVLCPRSIWLEDGTSSLPLERNCSIFLSTTIPWSILRVIFISDIGSEKKTFREGEWAEEGEELRGFWGRGGKGRVEVSEGKVEEGGVLRDVAEILTWSEEEIYESVGRSILGVNIFSATKTVRLCGKPTDHNLCLRSSKSAHNSRRVENVIYTPE